MVDSAERKEKAYETLHRNMLAMQLAVNNVLDRDISKIDSGSKPPGVRQVSAAISF